MALFPGLGIIFFIRAVQRRWRAAEKSDQSSSMEAAERFIAGVMLSLQGIYKHYAALGGPTVIADGLDLQLAVGKLAKIFCDDIACMENGKLCPLANHLHAHSGQRP
jgi:hypothetical protein